MKKISKLLSDNARFKQFKKPLEAANVCDIARAQADGQYRIISFRDGLLTIGCISSGQAANLQAKSGQIIQKINDKIGEDKVEKIRYKIIN